MNAPNTESTFQIPPDHECYTDDWFHDAVIRCIFFTGVYVWYFIFLLLLALLQGWVRPEFLGLKPCETGALCARQEPCLALCL